MENRVESMNINIIEENEEQSPKKFNKPKIIALVASGLILITLTIIFLVGYLQFGWFQKVKIIFLKILIMKIRSYYSMNLRQFQQKSPQEMEKKL